MPLCAKDKYLDLTSMFVYSATKITPKSSLDVHIDFSYGLGT